MKKCRTEEQTEENNQTTDELVASVLMAQFNFTKHNLFLDFYSNDFF